VSDDGVRELRAYLKREPSVHDLTEATEGTLDFRLFAPDAWPDVLDPDHLRVTRRSSVHLAGDRVAEATLHLPPIAESFVAECRETLALPGPWRVVFGSARTDGETSVYEGVATPHVVVREPAAAATAVTVVESCSVVYETVYDGGRRALDREP
jgi:hypothetical protein